MTHIFNPCNSEFIWGNTKTYSYVLTYMNKIKRGGRSMTWVLHQYKDRLSVSGNFHYRDIYNWNPYTGKIDIFILRWPPVAFFVAVIGSSFDEENTLYGMGESQEHNATKRHVICTLEHNTMTSVQAQTKENIKAPRHWPLCGEFTGYRWIPHTNGQ